MKKREWHGESNTRLYQSWLNMKARCYYEKGREYGNYGGRGIVVCDEWKNSYITFRDWALANGYNDNLTLDRIDVNNCYCPSNCRWITNKQQQSNRRNNRIIEYKGKKYTLAQLSELLEINEKTLQKRLLKNRTIDDPVMASGYNTTDLTGRRFGRWTVLSFAGYERCAVWNCRCDCGNEKKVKSWSLTSGRSKSCGCLQRELISKYASSNNSYAKEKSKAIKVTQYDTNMNIVNEFNGFLEAHKITSINKGNIVRAAYSNFHYKAGGFYWSARKEKNENSCSGEF